MSFTTNIYRRITNLIIAISFIATSVVTPAQAQSLIALPAPGVMVLQSSSYIPAVLTGITIHPENPFYLDFIIDTGNDELTDERLRAESTKLINYFLAALTVPEDQMWVNLSPNEPDRIVAEGLSQTEMGRDMLMQDYLLKQLTASLMFPDEKVGKEFWKNIQDKVSGKIKGLDISTDIYSKVWIVPDTASVYVSGANVFVNDSHLKVMLESDYLDMQESSKPYVVSNKNKPSGSITTYDLPLTTVNAIREVILPVIEEEVNNGKNFAVLRQMYHSMILATWYKNNLQKSILNKIYSNTNKVQGIDLEDKTIKEKIYNQYLEAFKQGVYDFIKEEYDPTTQALEAKRYFSGGLKGVDAAMLNQSNLPSVQLIEQLSRDGQVVRHEVDLTPQADAAMVSTHTSVLGEERDIGFNQEGRKAAGFRILNEIQELLPFKREDKIYPEGFVILSSATKEFRSAEDVSDGVYQAIERELRALEDRTGKKYGDPENPLILSVRSSPEYSMPGQLDTILNVGMTEQTVLALHRQSNDVRDPSVFNAYRRYIGHFGLIVMGLNQRFSEKDPFRVLLDKYLQEKGKVSEFSLTIEDQRNLIQQYKEFIKKETGEDFPESDADKQLDMSIESIAQSWDRADVKEFRREELISDDSGYGIIVQEMKFGNLSAFSGAGVMFSRDPITGDNQPIVEFMHNKQGSAVVAGKSREDQNQMESFFPQSYQQLVNIARILEKRLGRVVDIEFTIENNKLYILQIRPAELSVFAELEVLDSFIEEGIIDPVKRVNYLRRLQDRIKKRPILRVKEGVVRKVIGKGIVRSPGAIKAPIVLTKEEFIKLAEEGKPVIFAINEQRKKDFLIVLKYSDRPVGFIADYGNDLSHEIQLARKRQIPAVILRKNTLINGTNIMASDSKLLPYAEVLLDGHSGEISLTDDPEPLDYDSPVMKASFDVDIRQFRRKFLEEGDYLDPNGRGKPAFTSILDPELRDPQGVIRQRFTFTKLLELNWYAWRRFVEAEQAEKEDPTDLSKQKETIVHNLRKMILHELLRERGDSLGMSQDEIDRIYDDFMFGDKMHSFQSRIVYSHVLSEGQMTEEIKKEVDRQLTQGPNRRSDIYVRSSSQQRGEKVVVVIEPEKKERFISAYDYLSEEFPGLLVSPENQRGKPINPMIRSGEDGSIRFILGDYQVYTSDGQVINVTDDYWGREDIQERVSEIEAVMKEKYGENVVMHTMMKELRGHQRVGGGLTAYEISFSVFEDAKEEATVGLPSRRIIFTASMNVTAKEALKDMRKALETLATYFPGIVINEQVYAYEKSFEKEAVKSERYVFSVEQDLKLDPVKLSEAYVLLFSKIFRVRDFAYRSGGLFQINFPSLNLFHTNDAKEVLARVKEENLWNISSADAGDLVKGLELLYEYLNDQGINNPEADYEYFLNIELIQNLDSDSTEFNIMDYFLNIPFIFGLQRSSSKKYDNFYKPTIVVSLAQLRAWGQAGKLSQQDVDVLEKAIDQTDVMKTVTRSFEDIFGDKISSDQAMSSSSDNDLVSVYEKYLKDKSADAFKASLENEEEREIINNVLSLVISKRVNEAIDLVESSGLSAEAFTKIANFLLSVSSVKYSAAQQNNLNQLTDELQRFSITNAHLFMLGFISNESSAYYPIAKPTTDLLEDWVDLELDLIADSKRNIGKTVIKLFDGQERFDKEVQEVLAFVTKLSIAEQDDIFSVLSEFSGYFESLTVSEATQIALVNDYKEKAPEMLRAMKMEFFSMILEESLNKIKADNTEITTEAYVLTVMVVGLMDSEKRILMSLVDRFLRVFQNTYGISNKYWVQSKVKEFALSLYSIDLSEQFAKLKEFDEKDDSSGDAAMIRQNPLELGYGVDRGLDLERLFSGFDGVGVSREYLEELYDTEEISADGGASWGFEEELKQVDPQLVIYQQDLRRVIRAKRQQQDRRIVIFIQGLGNSPKETLQILTSTLGVLNGELDPDEEMSDWQVDLIGFDKSHKRVSIAQDHLRYIQEKYDKGITDEDIWEDFYFTYRGRKESQVAKSQVEELLELLQQLKGVKIRTAFKEANLRDVSSVMSAKAQVRQEWQQEVGYADYVFERHLSYVQDRVSSENRLISEIFLNFIFRTNSLSVFGKNGTRYVNESSAHLGDYENPYVPNWVVVRRPVFPGSELVYYSDIFPEDKPDDYPLMGSVNTGTGFSIVTDINRATQATLHDSLEAINNFGVDSRPPAFDAAMASFPTPINTSEKMNRLLKLLQGIDQTFLREYPGLSLPEVNDLVLAELLSILKINVLRDDRLVFMLNDVEVIFDRDNLDKTNKEVVQDDGYGVLYVDERTFDFVTPQGVYRVRGSHQMSIPRDFTAEKLSLDSIETNFEESVSEIQNVGYSEPKALDVSAINRIEYGKDLGRFDLDGDGLDAVREVLGIDSAVKAMHWEYDEDSKEITLYTSYSDNRKDTKEKLTHLWQAALIVYDGQYRGQAQKRFYYPQKNVTIVRMADLTYQVWEGMKVFYGIEDVLDTLGYSEDRYLDDNYGDIFSQSNNADDFAGAQSYPINDSEDHDGLHLLSDGVNKLRGLLDIPDYVSEISYYEEDGQWFMQYFDRNKGREIKKRTGKFEFVVTKDTFTQTEERLYDPRKDWTIVMRSRWDIEVWQGRKLEKDETGVDILKSYNDAVFKANLVQAMIDRIGKASGDSQRVLLYTWNNTAASAYELDKQEEINLTNQDILDEIFDMFSRRGIVIGEFQKPVAGENEFVKDVGLTSRNNNLRQEIIEHLTARKEVLDRKINDFKSVSDAAMTAEAQSEATIQFIMHGRPTALFARKFLSAGLDFGEDLKLSFRIKMDDGEFSNEDFSFTFADLLNAYMYVDSDEKEILITAQSDKLSEQVLSLLADHMRFLIEHYKEDEDRNPVPGLLEPLKEENQRLYKKLEQIGLDIEPYRVEPYYQAWQALGDGADAAMVSVENYREIIQETLNILQFYRDEDIEQALEVISKAMNKVQEYYKSPDRLKKAGVDEFAEFLNIKKINFWPSVFRGTPRKALFRVSEEVWAQIQLYVSRPGLSLEGSGIDGPGIYYFPQEIDFQHKIRGSETFGLTAFFHEYLEEKFAESGLSIDLQLRWSLGLHIHPGVLVGELAFAQWIDLQELEALIRIRQYDRDNAWSDMKKSGLTLNNRELQRYEEILDVLISKAKKLLSSDSAMKAEVPGGIDFNASNLDLNETGDVIDFDFDESFFDGFNPNAFQGITPVIINTTPVTNIPLLLGLKQEEYEYQLSRI